MKQEIIDRLYKILTEETSDLSRADYIEVLEETRDNIQTLLDAAAYDEQNELEEDV